MRGLFDTNILLDYLKGLPEASDELARYDTHLVSVVSVADLHLAARDDQQDALDAFLRIFTLVAIDEAVAREAAAIKRLHRNMKLPHALVLASARLNDALLVTRNHKQFPVDAPDIRVPY